MFFYIYYKNIIMEELKKYWWLITFIFAGISAAAIWIANIDSKTFESPKQREKHEYHVTNSLTPLQQHEKFVKDTANAGSATRARALRLKREARNDSIKTIKDSLIYDVLQRQAVQTQLQTQRLEKIERKLGN
tara:strand:+ start:500 stop:898 length:399 start_codon:yes stop_codon:yes gene_type:complete